jgi:hypothetical protein
LLCPWVLLLSLLWFVPSLRIDPLVVIRLWRHRLLFHQKHRLWNFFIILQHCMYDGSDSVCFCMQALTSSVDAGRL